MVESRKNSESSVNDDKFTLFRFEISGSQAVWFLIISLLGVFMMVYNFGITVFINLFNFLFFNIPHYINEPEHYSPDFLVGSFVLILLNIVEYSIYLLLSFYTMKRILRKKSTHSRDDTNPIKKERIVNWLGLDISHGQSLFLFSLSIIGIIFSVKNFIISYIYTHFGLGYFEGIGVIPIGAEKAISPALSFYIPGVIYISFFIFSFYTLYITRKDESVAASKIPMVNYKIVLFIVSLVVLILSAARFSCHVSILLFEKVSIVRDFPNQYQLQDFNMTILLLGASAGYIISNYVLERKPEGGKDSIEDLKELTIFKVKITPKRGLIIFSFAFAFTIHLLTSYISFFLFFSTSMFRLTDFITYNLIFLPWILLSFYLVGKLVKKNRIKHFINKVKDSEEYETQWFGFHLDRLQSLIVFSTSLSLLLITVLWALNIVNRIISLFVSVENFDFVFLLSNLLIGALLCVILVILAYTMKKTFHSIKSSE